MVRGVRFNVVRLGPGAVGAPEEPAGPGDPAEVGVAPTVVFLHGLIMDNLSSFYYTLAPIVARTHEVVCYDLRGHGHSDRPRTGYRLEDGVDDLFGILDALGLPGPAALVGNSFGGTIALAAALRCPVRVAGLALVEAHPAFAGWDTEMIEDLEDLVAGFDGPGIRDYLASGAPRGLRRMIATCEDLVAGCSMGDDFRASALTPPEHLAAVSCPALLVYGEASDVLDRAYALEEALPRAELRIVPGCSHALLMEAPEAVADAVVPWLASLDRRDRTGAVR